MRKLIFPALCILAFAMLRQDPPIKIYLRSHVGAQTKGTP